MKVLMAVAWFSRQRREWMKYRTIEEEETISSSNRGTRPANGLMRTMPGEGDGAEGVSVIEDDAIASRPAEQTAAVRPQAGVGVAAG